MWTYECIFYQIYPIGFCGAPRENDGVVVPRIRKIIDWGEYLSGLSVGAVLLNPVFSSDRHGYDTRDFRQLDCRLGTNQDLRDVCDALHARGIRVVLDGVFNHVGRGFWAFRDVQEHGWDSLYKDWFCIRFDGDSPYGDGFWYEGWEGHYELVKLNLQNPAVTDYLLETVRFWMDTFGIDGLRLDVAYCLDPEFMKRLRAFVREIRPDFTLIGEVLFGDYNRIVNDEMLDSCTNYECYKGLYSSFNSMNLFEIAHSLHRQFGDDPWCLYRGRHLLSFVDNHDVSRIASTLTNPAHLPLIYALLMGMPGVPCIYYGSEWGEPGLKTPGNDDALRPAFAAPKPNGLTDTLRDLIRLRRHSRSLCYGGYRNVVITNRQLIFERRTDGARTLVCVNADAQDYTARHGDLTGSWQNARTEEMLTLDGSLLLPAHTAIFLTEGFESAK